MPYASRGKQFILQAILLLWISLFFSACHTDASRLVTVTFRVELHTAARAERMFLSGNLKALGRWRADGLQMDRANDTVWTAALRVTHGDDIEYKANGGSWWAEALDSAGHRYNNFKLHPAGDTTVTVHVYGWDFEVVDGKPVIAIDRFAAESSGLILSDLWKYRTGDSADWAADTYDDIAWSYAEPSMNWLADSVGADGGTGWFRFHAAFDSSLWNKTIALSISQLGASEIFYNGRLLYAFGTIGTAQASYKPSQNRLWKALTIEPRRDQLFAVRYTNHQWKEHLKLGFSPGFIIYLRDVNTVFALMPDALKNIAARQMIFTSIPLILFMLHLCLYTFYPVRKQNLFYAFCLLGFAGITYFGYQRFFSVDPEEIILYYRLNSLSMPLAVFFGLMTGYAISGPTLPRRWLLFLVLYVAACVIAVVDPLDLSPKANYVFFGSTIIDLVFSPLHAKNRAGQEGSWIILWGFIVLVLFVLVQVLVDFAVIVPPFNERQWYVFGMFAFILSMSVFLSYNFSLVNKSLILQLETVKQLSRNAIEQEKAAARLELEHKLQDAENNRKTRELESARQLQLSLLPKDVPALDHLDIGCFMSTATEVGGDYYDFFIGADGALTAAVGDATGHGLKAGMMVILSKGLFNILSTEGELVRIMERANTAIKNMNLNQLTMCLSLVRITGTVLSYSSAGIPPLLVRRNATGLVERLVLKAMPLGAFHGFPYASRESTLCVGDSILMMSDGVTEMFNGSGDTFGIDRVAEAFADAGTRSAGEIVELVHHRCTSWASGAPLADDMTIVVIKVLK